MVKEVIRYQADDGTVFNTVEQAQAHDKVCKLAEELADESNSLYFPKDGSDAREVAEWILERYYIERKPK
jgi:adenosylmethionine-8-amino-7-oxononanoate aminotransferase